MFTQPVRRMMSSSAASTSLAAVPRELPLYLAGRAVPSTGASLAVQSKFDGAHVASVPIASAEMINEAFEAAESAREAMQRVPHYTRKAVLERISQTIDAQRDLFAAVLSYEVGKPLKDSLAEVMRAVDTFSVASGETIRQIGEFAPYDMTPRGHGFSGIIRRFPIGVVSLITPFNFPLNLVAHKVAPAIAAGCPFVLKPDERTPLSALLLGKILADCGLPDGSFSILPCNRADASIFVTHAVPRLVSFTGSSTVGWMIRDLAKGKKVHLELGGNAAVIVSQAAIPVGASAAERSRIIDHIASRIAFGAFYSSGQSCISVQRVYIHESLADEISALVVSKAKAMKTGNPFHPDTFLGPLINEAQVTRTIALVEDAVKCGATLACGAQQSGAFLDATVLLNAPEDCQLQRNEVFAPVCSINRFTDFKDVVKKVNDSAYGLQTGVFSRDMAEAFYAFENLEVGGVVINDVSASRVDAQPYGGVKNSGMGREGLKYAIEEMTEPRIMLMKDISSL